MLLDREAPHRGLLSAIAILKVRLGVALVIGIDVDPDVGAENLARRDIPGERVKAGQRIRRRSGAPTPWTLPTAIAGRCNRKASSRARETAS